ncbi:MAG: DUF4747 family protein, partial [Anaerolineales bacterium]|nr:DUF4747 family protein [Anaerolineales bacterium]
MARPKTIKIGALNITTHPHSSEGYIRLFQEASKIKWPVNYWGNYFAKIGYLHNMDSGQPEKGLSGYIRRFIDVDKSKPWLNTKEDKEAAKEDLEELNWPDHLKPQFTSARFI